MQNQTQGGSGRGRRGNNSGIPFAPVGVGTVVQATAQAGAFRLSITKAFTNWNVCYLCGFNIEDGHTSVACPHTWRKTNHQEGFNRNNVQAYLNAGWDPSTKGMHKTKFLGF
jgi:hypothetical protein